MDNKLINTFTLFLAIAGMSISGTITIFIQPFVGWVIAECINFCISVYIGYGLGTFRNNYTGDYNG